MQELKLVSPIAPSVNHYCGVRAIIKNGKPMTMMYKKPEAVKYQKKFAEYVKQQAKEQNWVMSENRFQHYYMDCVFYFDRIDMDANNCFKCLADAITDAECVWIDDTQLCERVQGIFYDAENPRIEITITPVLYTGIFNSASRLKSFENNCIGCTRYKRNCSILRKAKEGRIQKEITGTDEQYQCEKFTAIKA